MAGRTLIAQISEQALAAGVLETLLQILAPTNIRLKIKSWGVFFDGIVVTEAPVQVELLRQTGAGTSSALTLVSLESAYAEIIQSSALQSFTAEPTAGSILASKEVHPQGGYEIIRPLGDEIPVPGAGRVGIRATAPSAVNARAFIEFEE